MEKLGVLSTVTKRGLVINSYQLELQSSDTNNLLINTLFHLGFHHFSTISTGLTTTTNFNYQIKVKTVLNKPVNKPEVPLHLL